MHAYGAKHLDYQWQVPPENHKIFNSLKLMIVCSLHHPVMKHKNEIDG